MRYSWDSPNPFFLPALAGARPAYIYAPSHWLRRFHARYEDRERLDHEARARGRRSWASIHNRKDSPYRNLDTEAPTLQPWRNVTPEPRPALRVPPQPVLPSRRWRRPAASLPRRGGDDGDRHEAHPGEDGGRGVRPPGARPRVRRLHLPQAEREADRAPGAAVEDHQGLARRPVSEPERERSRLAHAASRRPVPASPVARHRSARDQPHPVPRLRGAGEQHRRRELAALPARAAGAVGGVRSRARQRPPRRVGACRA